MIVIGTRVRVKTINKEGTVIELKDNFARITIDAGSQASPTWYPTDELEEIEQLVDRFLRNDLDDPLDFILSIDAYRLLTEYRFNPYVLASSTKISIYPHQIDEVFRMIDNPRMMLADEVGLGKTISAALVASELKARGLINRMLFAVPKSIVTKWRDELNDRFELDARVIDSEYVKVNGNPFLLTEFCYIGSMDYLKQRHVMNMMEQDLDFSLVDEAHKLSPGTDLLELGKYLSTKSNFMLLLSATPHNGNDDDYLSRMNLLDPYVSDITSSRYLLIRNLKEDVVDLDGKEVFPPRESKTIEIPSSQGVTKVRRMLDDYLQELAVRATNRAEQNAIRFLSTILRKRAASSIHSLRLSMERRLEKLGSVADIEEAVARRSRQTEEEESEDDYERNEGDFIGYTPHKTKTAAEADQIRGILDAIHNCGSDSKLEELKRSIRKIKKGDKDAKIVVFTEYRDTLSYIKEQISGFVKVDSIDGSMNIKERNIALSGFKKGDGPEVMLCTDAAGEGIDMQFCNIEINYDIPWNPNKLEQRMGRIHRIGQNKKVFYYNFILDPDNTIDGYILAQMLKKIESIRTALGNRVYDILGRLISEEEITNLYEDLLKAPKEEWKAKIKEFDGLVERKRVMLERLDGMLAGYRLDRTKLEDMKKVIKEAVDKNEVKRFVEVFINSRQGTIVPINESEELYRLFIPKDLPLNIESKIVEGSFNSEVAQKKNYPFLALGNKAIMALVHAGIKPRVGLLKHPYLEGLLFIYRLTVKDGEGKDRDGKLVSILYDDGNIRHVDARSIWDFEPVYEDQHQQPSRTVSTKTLIEVKGRIEKEVISRIMNDLLNSVNGRLAAVQKKAEEIITNHAANKIGDIDRKLEEYRSKVSEGPHFLDLIKKGENEKYKIKSDTDTRIKDLKRKYSAYSVIELVALAEVLKDIGGDARKKVELAGMAKVLEYERKRAQNEGQLSKIKDVSDRLTGYDIESFDRVIEVKSFTTTGKIEITSHEWATASRIKDDYWLYVVEDALGEGKISIFRNPVETFRDIVSKEAVVDYRYIIYDWKNNEPDT